MTCQQISQWFTDNVEKPLMQWLMDAYQQCTQAQRWLEELRTELENWQHQQQTRCREQECNWWCLCCNKWFCWLVDVLVSIISVIIQTIEHVIEAVCKLIVTLIWFVIWILVQIVKAVVLAVICFLASLCSLFILIGALALLVVLLGILVLSVPPLAAVAIPLIAPAAIIAVVALVLARLLCEAGLCRILGAIGWAFKWAIVLGALIAIFFLNALSALTAAIYGGVIAALSILIQKIPCKLPAMLGLP